MRATLLLLVLASGAFAPGCGALVRPGSDGGSGGGMGGGIGGASGGDGGAGGSAGGGTGGAGSVFSGYRQLATMRDMLSPARPACLTAVAMDDSGIVWVGGENYTYLLQGAMLLPARSFPGPVNAIVATGGTAVLIATQNDGLWTVGSKAGPFDQVSLPTIAAWKGACVAGDDVWAVGVATGGSNSVVVRRHQGVWTQEFYGTNVAQVRACAATPRAMLAAGLGSLQGFTVLADSGVALDYEDLPTPAQPDALVDVQLMAVAVRGATFHLAGEGQWGAARQSPDHYLITHQGTTRAGAAWTSLATTTTGRLVATAGTDGLAIFDGTSWSRAQPAMGFDVRAAAAAPDGGVYLAGCQDGYGVLFIADP